MSIQAGIFPKEINCGSVLGLLPLYTPAQQSLMAFLFAILPLQMSIDS